MQLPPKIASCKLEPCKLVLQGEIGFLLCETDTPRNWEN